MSKLILLSEGDKVSVSVDTFCGKNYNHAVSTSKEVCLMTTKKVLGVFLLVSVLFCSTACKASSARKYTYTKDSSKYIELAKGSDDESGKAYCKKVYVTGLGECTGNVKYKRNEKNNAKLDFNYSSGWWTLESYQWSASSSTIVICGRTYEH